MQRNGFYISSCQLASPSGSCACCAGPFSPESTTPRFRMRYIRVLIDHEVGTVNSATCRQISRHRARAAAAAAGGHRRNSVANGSGGGGGTLCVTHHLKGRVRNGVHERVVVVYHQCPESEVLCHLCVDCRASRNRPDLLPAQRVVRVSNCGGAKAVQNQCGPHQAGDLVSAPHR